jgi:hypothetical protein
MPQRGTSGGVSGFSQFISLSRQTKTLPGATVAISWLPKEVILALIVIDLGPGNGFHWAMKRVP